MKRAVPVIKRIVSLLLVLAAAGTLFQIASRYPFQWDITQNSLNSLEKVAWKYWD